MISKLLVLIFSTMMLSVTFSPVLAQDILCQDPAYKAINTEYCQQQTTNENVSNNKIIGPNGLLTRTINVMSFIVGVAAVIAIIIGGFMFITSGGDPQSTQRARSFIIYAIVGVVVALLAQSIVVFVLTKL